MFLIGGVAYHYLEAYPTQTLTLALNRTLTLDPDPNHSGVYESMKMGKGGGG
jgi:hypothetical protein